tara:strand:- start:508 stop:1335 length:828 start_codon:yes stop_codon:yes gene_type:complete
MQKAIQNKKEYCEKNNYAFVARDFQPMPAERSITWHRFQNILDIFSSKDAPDWVMHTDIDSLFMNDNKKLENFTEIAEGFGKKAIFCQQTSGIISDKNCQLIATNNQIAAGHFFIKNCTWSKNLLKKMWEFPYEDEKFLKLLFLKFHEQDTMNTFFRDNRLCMRDNSMVVDNRQFNAFFPAWHLEEEDADCDFYREGDFIVHFGALNWEQREALITEYLHRKSNPDKSTWQDIPYERIINGITYEQLKHTDLNIEKSVVERTDIKPKRTARKRKK